MTELLTESQECDLLDQAHLCGLSDLHVLALVNHGRNLMLIENRPAPGAPLWTVPHSPVLPGELIAHAFKRLISRCLGGVGNFPARYLGFSGDLIGDTAYCVFGLDVSNRSCPDDIFGVEHTYWWDPQSARPLPLSPAVQAAMETVYLSTS